MVAVGKLEARRLVKKYQSSWPPTSFLALLASEALDELIVGRSATEFVPRQPLMIEGSTPECVFLLVDAVVKVTRGLGKGVALLAVRVSGDVVGEMAVADGGSRSATVTVTRRQSLAIAVPADDFMAVVDRHPDAGRLLTAQLSRKLRYSDEMRADFSTYEVSERVARVLAKLADDYGQPRYGMPTTLMLRVGITQQELATLVGAAKSTVQEALKEFDKRKILTWGYRGAVDIWDIDALRRAGQMPEPA